MGIFSWFRRVGSDPYYASYEKSLSRISQDTERAKARSRQRQQLWARMRARFWAVIAAVYAVVLAYAAWVLRQPPGRFTAAEHSARVSPVLLVPLAAYLLHWALGGLVGLLAKRDARRAQILEGKLRKQVAELKDSTHYEKTLELLKKYDPDFVPPLPPPPPPQLIKAVPQGRPQGPPGSSSKAATVASSAGTLLGQLWSHAADKLIADDPVMLRLMREAQRESEDLRLRLADAEARSARLSAENAQLREQLGLPPAEEEGERAAAAAAAAATGGQEGQQGGQAAVAAGGSREAGEAAQGAPGGAGCSGDALQAADAAADAAAAKGATQGPNQGGPVPEGSGPLERKGSEGGKGKKK